MEHLYSWQEHKYKEYIYGIVCETKEISMPDQGITEISQACLVCGPEYSYMDKSQLQLHLKDK